LISEQSDNDCLVFILVRQVASIVQLSLNTRRYGRADNFHLSRSIPSFFVFIHLKLSRQRHRHLGCLSVCCYRRRTQC